MEEPLFTSAEGTSHFCAFPNFEYFDGKHSSIRHYRVRYLWEEYRQACLRAGERPYAFSTFQGLLSNWRRENIKKTLPGWYPGEYMQCYWSRLDLRNLDGSPRRQALLVAILPYSDCAFACACEDTSTASWMQGCIKAYRYFGGVPFVTECELLEKETFRRGYRTLTLQAFSAHYKTVLFHPCPKTKKSASEQCKPLVLMRRSHLVKLLREKLEGSDFASIQALNEAIEEIACSFNAAKRSNGKSRKETFQQMELPQLLSLPHDDYDMAIWFERVVKSDYHFVYGFTSYSVPYRYAHKKVRVRVSERSVEAYYMGARVASHAIPEKAMGKRRVTDPSHRPVAHKIFTERFEDRFMPLAREVGPAAGAVMQEVLSDCKRAEKGYRPCKDLLDLQKTPSGITLEQACMKAIEGGLSMTVETVASIMREGAR